MGGGKGGQQGRGHRPTLSLNVVGGPSKPGLQSAPVQAKVPNRLVTSTMVSLFIAEIGLRAQACNEIFNPLATCYEGRISGRDERHDDPVAGRVDDDLRTCSGLGVDSDAMRPNPLRALTFRHT